MKLAPSQNTLQPLPPDVQPAVSENVQRTASPADLQAAQNLQAIQQQQSSVQQTSALPVTPYVPTSSMGTTLVWIVVIVALIIGGAFFWFWKAF